MERVAKSGILTMALLSGVIGQVAKSIDKNTANSGIPNVLQYADSSAEGVFTDILASNSKTKGNVVEKAKRKNPVGSGGIIDLDTVLTDSLFGRKVYFRIARKETAEPFGSGAIDTTADRLDCVAGRDSSIFTFRNGVDHQFFQFYRIPGKDSRKSYLLHIEQYPSAPPSGNSAVVIAPVNGSLKVLSPGEMRFNGSLPNFSPGKIDGPPDEVLISVMNGYLDIQVPIRVESMGDSSFLVPPVPKSVVLSKATALNFKLTNPPKKSAYQENADLTLYMDLDRKKAIKIKTPRFDQFEARSVWILMKSKAKKYPLQNILDACADLENALLEVRVGNTIGFILYDDFMGIGFEPVG